MKRDSRPCPDCGDSLLLPRRTFLAAAGATAAAAAIGLPATARAADEKKAAPESLVKTLYGTLTPKQKETICFEWDHKDSKRGLLRTHISNNWHITKPIIESEFYTKDQQQLVRAIFEGLIQPEWQPHIDKQLKDDAGGWGKTQNVAIFGNPNEGKFELVITGRHMTLRCDGNSTEHVAFGGPIFYGHTGSTGFYEKPGHPDNVFWPQAQAAGSVYAMLDGKQREKALIEKSPVEVDVGFKKELPGIRVSELSKDQQANVEIVLKKLLEPYRQSDRDEVGSCLKAQGGLEACHLAFYKEGDLNPSDNDWDIWRLQGPSFVWSFRGVPHVHVWVNISDSPNVELNAGTL